MPAGPLTIGDRTTTSPSRATSADSASTTAPSLPPTPKPWRARTLRCILAQDETKRTKDQNQRLLDYFLTCDAAPELRRVYAELNTLKAKLAQAKKEIVTSQVMAEMAKPRDTFVLARGDYRNQTEKVTPGVPLLPPMPKDAPANRLGLASGSSARASPHRARGRKPLLAVHFGIGLVKTAEDFGSQGDAPVQRDLLDWLATEFQAPGT